MEEKEITQVVEETTQTENKQELQEAITNSMKEIKSDNIIKTQNTQNIQLPSNGLINPDITEVTLRRMTVKETKTLWTSNDPDFLTNVILGCIVEPINIKAEDLHPKDINYLTFILRYISSPKKLERKYRCTSCGKIFTDTVSIPELKVKYATPDEYNYYIKLPDCGDSIKLHILSEGELRNIEKISTRKAKQLGLDDDAWSILISKTSKMLEEINDEPTVSITKTTQYLESLSAYDFDTIHKAYNDIIHSFGMETNYFTECPHCKDAIEVTAYYDPDFFQLA